jgi:hypothetical protein
MIVLSCEARIMLVSAARTDGKRRVQTMSVKSIDRTKATLS